MSRFAPSRSLSDTVAVTLRAALVGVSLFAFAAPTVLIAPAAVAQEAKAADPLASAAEDFWHYGKVARYDVAVAKANEVLQANAPPRQILEVFEKVAKDRGDDLDDWLIRFQGIDPLKDVAGKLAEAINKGRSEKYADPKYIAENIAKLNGGDRPYRLAMVQLRQSGELAVPQMLDVINDPSKTEMHGAVRRGLISLGKKALTPLVAATMSTDPAQLQTVVGVLGDLGLDAAVPYLSRLAEVAPTGDVKRIAMDAVTKINISGSNTPMTGKAGDQFFQLAEKQYYGKTSLSPDRTAPMANFWTFQKDKGLISTPVPAAIFNDVMTLSEAEQAMTLGTTQDALSLWLAGDFKREADLPAGVTDMTRPAGGADAHFYGVTAGAQYLNAVLARALNDRNNAVALASVKALQEIVGDSNFKAGGSPLIDAMQSPDRRVRFEAAFTIAEALPQTGFQGQELVVPLLAEAVSQTGQPSVLVVMPTQEGVNAVVQPLKGQGFIAAGSTTASGALAAAAGVPAIDVILVSEDLSPVETESLLSLVSRSPKLRAAGKLFIVKSAASQWETRKNSDPTISTTMSADPALLKDAIDKARLATGALPLDPALALTYATRAGQLIQTLAISRGQVLDLAPSRSTLLGALEDTRPEVAKLAGVGLSLMNNDDAQKGILLRATADGVPDDVKVSLFQSLATSAKFFGNKLDASQAEALDSVVTGTASADIKSAAAEARGALNLPSEQARKLILNPSMMPSTQTTQPQATQP